jgi:outer membrane scaffolding protein for murein synthesis (MipA/OmpV family)
MSNSNFIKLPLILSYAALTALIANSISVSFAEVPDIYTQNSTLPSLSGFKEGKDTGIIGVAAMSGAQGAGGNNNVSLMPIVEYHWANGWFAGTRQGLGYNFTQNPDFQYGAFLNVDLGRPPSNQSNEIKGISPKPVLGTFANYSLTHEWMLSSALRYGSGDNGQGATIDFGTNYNLELSPRLHLGTGVGATFANADYMQSYFGVNAEQSQSAVYAQYSPSAGLKDLRVNLTLHFEVSKEVAVTTGLTATRLSEAAKNSPIVNPSDAVSGMMALTYAF